MSPILKGHQTHYCGLVLRMQIHHLSFLRRLYKLVLKSQKSDTMNQTLDLDTESKRSSENAPQTTLHRQDSCGLPRQGQHLAPWVYVHHGGGGQVLPV